MKKQINMGKGKKLTGVIVSDKMELSVVVKIERFIKDKKYSKFLRRSKKYTVHNPDNKHKTGERVTIQECNPISKRKHFIII